MPNIHQTLHYYNSQIYIAILSATQCFIALFSIFLHPFAWALMLWGQLAEFCWQNVRTTLNDIYNFLIVIPLVILLCFWSMECTLTYWCGMKNLEETSITIKENIYENLKVILTAIGVLPIPQKACERLYVILKYYMNIVFGAGRVPWPDFLFENLPPEFKEDF